MLLGEALGDNIQGSLSLFQVCSRLEPSHEGERAFGATSPRFLDLFVGFCTGVYAERKVEIGIDDGKGAVKFLGSNTHDSELLAVYVSAFPDHSCFPPA